MELQNHRRRKGDGCTFYHADVAGILAHPYVAECDAALTRTMHEEIVRDRRISVDAAWLGRNELLKRIFTPAATWRELSDYMLDVVAAVARQPYEGDDARQRVEFLAVIAEQVTKLRNSLDECDIDLTAEVYTSLLRRHLQTLRIPFEGEPLEGIQIMGILETRNLDFENVIILSMNDDNFPGNHMAQASFIPYNLRAAYELPTPEHHEGVYAYYFYRLIQRAKTVHMLYCSHADDKSTGEPSRYIYQLDYESGFDVRKVEVGVDVNLAETAPIEVPKDEGVMVRLERFVDAQSPATLSPTAFFRYVACPLRFYFHSIARLEADDEISEEVDAPMFGTILHAAVQTLYARIAGEAHPGETLRAMIRTGEVAQAVEAAINQNYLQDKHATAEDYSGNLLLVKDIVIRYLRGGVMPYDAAHDAFSVSGLEEPVAYPFRFRAGGRDLEMKFAGHRRPYRHARRRGAEGGGLQDRGAASRIRRRGEPVHGHGQTTPFEHPANAALRDDAAPVARLRRRTGALLRPQHEPPRLFAAAGRQANGGEGGALYALPRAFRGTAARAARRTLRHLGSVPPVRGCRYLQVLRLQRDLQALTGCVVTGADKFRCRMVITPGNYMARLWKIGRMDAVGDGAEE